MALVVGAPRAETALSAAMSGEALPGRCPSCGAAEVTHEFDLGCDICSACGHVLSERALSTSVQYDDAGALGTFLHDGATHGGHLAAARGGLSLAAGGAPSMARKMFRDEEATHLENIARSVTFAAGQLKLPRDAAADARALVTRASEGRWGDGDWTVLLVGACVYCAARQNQLPITMRDVAEACQLDVFALGRVFNKLKRIHDVRLPPVDPKAFVARAAAAVPEEAYHHAHAEKTPQKHTHLASEYSHADANAHHPNTSEAASRKRLRPKTTSAPPPPGGASAAASDRDAAGPLLLEEPSPSVSGGLTANLRSAHLAPLVRDARRLLDFAHTRGVATGKVPEALVAASLGVAAAARGSKLSAATTAAAARCGERAATRATATMRAELLAYAADAFEWARDVDEKTLDEYLPAIVRCVDAAFATREAEAERERRRRMSSTRGGGEDGGGGDARREEPTRGTGGEREGGAPGAPDRPPDRRPGSSSLPPPPARGSGAASLALEAMPPAFRAHEATRAKRAERVALAKRRTRAAFSLGGEAGDDSEEGSFPDADDDDDVFAAKRAAALAVVSRSPTKNNALVSGGLSERKAGGRGALPSRGGVKRRRTRRGGGGGAWGAPASPARDALDDSDGKKAAAPGAPASRADDVGWGDVALQRLMLRGVPERVLLDEGGLFPDERGGVGIGVGDRSTTRGGASSSSRLLSGVEPKRRRVGRKGSHSSPTRAAANAAALRASRRRGFETDASMGRDRLLEASSPRRRASVPGGVTWRASPDEDAIAREDLAAIDAIPDEEIAPLLKTAHEMAVAVAVMESALGGAGGGGGGGGGRRSGPGGGSGGEDEAWATKAETREEDVLDEGEETE